MQKPYGTYSSEISKREKENYELAKAVAREGITLLKNENALPLKNKNIALFGLGARRTVACGVGSGSVQPRYNVTIEQGLINEGFIITTKAYLDDCDAECDQSYKQWKAMVEEKIADIAHPSAQIIAAHKYLYQCPSGRGVSQIDIAQSKTDTAIYVLVRQAGECNDRRLEKGDFYITDEERQNIEIVARAYKNMILVINVGGLIDLSFLEGIGGINAVIYYTQGGMEGGNALAQLLCGKYSFCGKLTDTWAMHYNDIPFFDKFSYLNTENKEENYSEGVYVGYRYFDSFNIVPRFTFGFGLSYTSFSSSVKAVQLSGTVVKATVRVENTGKEYTGKEVIQAYVSFNGKSNMPIYQQLVDFAKTAELKPSKSQSIDLSFDLKDLAQYDEKTSAWILEQGEYILRLGNASNNTQQAAVFNLNSSVVTEKCKPCGGAKNKITKLCAKDNSIIIDSGVKRFEVDSSKIATKINLYELAEFKESKQVSDLLNILTTLEMAELLRGADLYKQVAGSLPLIGSGGTTANTLLEKGIININLIDGPAGLNIFEELAALPDGTTRTIKIPEKYNWGKLPKMQSAIPEDAKLFYRYATGWPIEILLAQTWDKQLIENVGKAIGEEMTEFGVTLWLAPGMNIHRNPLCGRNFEYFSEDPLLTGKLAAAMTKGVQSCSGVGVTIKHFCCNNREDDRILSCSNVDENVLRQIYLKGFEIAVKESQPMAIMGSYNKLNGVYTANRKDLMTDILRTEWGYKGIVMTDWGSCDEGYANPALCVPAGTDLIMIGGDRDKNLIISALEKCEISQAQLRTSAARILQLIVNSNRWKEHFSANVEQ